MINARAQKEIIPVEESFAAWRKDPAYVAAYDALEDEFARAMAMIEARAGGHQGRGGRTVLGVYNGVRARSRLTTILCFQLTSS
jgi:hypothetical protein